MQKAKKNGFKTYTISFCTTCMNRLDHLQRTLRANLLDNLEYVNLEYVVLNYNSKDEIDNWIKAEMMEYINNGKVVYIKTLEPEYFRMAHAKNMVTKFASGDIVCNIDADNFTGKGFANYVNEQFNIDSNIFLAGGQDGFSDLSGRICLWKSDFLRIRGYDESILDYSYEDTDVYSRLKKRLGRAEVKIIDTKYLGSIPHDNYQRMINGKYYSEIELALSCEIDSVLKAYILKVNNEFEYLTIVPSDSKELIIDYVKYRCGKWNSIRGAIECKDSLSGESTILRTSDEGHTYSSKEGLYRQVPKIDACLYYSVLKGRMVFRENIRKDNEVNNNGFGEGSSYEVFKT